MLVREARQRPPSWSAYMSSVPRWVVPFHALEWFFQWWAWILSRWAFLEVLEYLGTLSVLVAVISYWMEAPDRKKQKHYQAWQVINTAQGKGGSGGRIDALQELNADGVPLVGVDASGAFLQGIRLRHANLLRANLEAADLRDCVLEDDNLEYASLKSANFRRGSLQRTDLRQADIEDADLVGASLAGADLTGADLRNADLRKTDWRGVRWQEIRAIDSANVYGVRNAPPGFMEWALAHGAISVRGEDE